MRVFQIASLALAFSTGLALASQPAEDDPHVLPPCAWCPSGASTPPTAEQISANVLVTTQMADGECHMNNHIPSDCVESLGCRYIVQIATIDPALKPQGLIGEARLSDGDGYSYGESFSSRYTIVCGENESLEVAWGWIDSSLNWVDDPARDSYAIELICQTCEL